ncbi:nucleic acid binding OB-fold tRNA/helicase-type [Thermocrinis albus DSM 14484]|uniref:Nucleic acid binding OB-fold tRNA/helicase-type n=1 Tax=Thermocrinis albus (strain DSM 14484 / JCM 11386 / HI 11/12) TaxID=638303 RepID=D3SLZ7_THEAH|nr:DNA-binding protein [Thermocrinis albus]ADC89777.1 nucleic acid binding OB-fold tRNA/helicase-type [Thermocrinis albus DSM 14484]
MRKRFYSAVFIFLSFISFLYAEDYITPEQAGNYIGEVKTVCGVVASAKYASHSRGQPTFLNLDRPYPNHIFTVVIWGKDRHKFSHPPESYYKGKRICVEGLIDSYRGVPQIVVRDPSQIRVR